MRSEGDNMKTEKTYQQELQKLADLVDARYEAILQRDAYATFDTPEHTMQVEAKQCSNATLEAECQEMEQAELIDFFNIERNYGRTNKKR